MLSAFLRLLSDIPFCELLGSLSSFCASSILSVSEPKKSAVFSSRHFSQRAAGRLAFPPGVRRAYGGTPDIPDSDRHFPNQ